MLGHDRGSPPGIDEVCVGPHTKLHGEGVDHLHPLRPLIVMRPERRVRKGRLGIDGTLERIGYIVGIRQLTVVPIHVVSDVKRDLAIVVRHVPRLGQIRHRIKVFVVLHQSHEVHKILVLRSCVILRNMIVHTVGDLADRTDDRRAAIPLGRRHLPFELGHERRNVCRDLLTERDTRSGLGQRGFQHPGSGCAGGPTVAAPTCSHHHSQPS